MPYRTVLAIILLLFTTSVFTAQERSLVQLKTVVIDPGHGGHDPGAVSRDGRVKEKDITLPVSLKLGELIKKNYPDVNVIFTRKTDVAVPLDKRSEIANKNKADLFISIHVNSVESRQANGSETFVMGMERSASNLEVVMLENSVILLEGDDYSTRYEGFNPNDPESYIVFSLMQNAHFEQSFIMASLVQQNFNNGPIPVNRGVKQAPFIVLWKSGMPGILVELGFISNANDLRILSDRRNHPLFAEKIFNAFSQFKVQYEKGNSQVSDFEYKTPPAEQTVTQSGNNNYHYRVQILSVSKQLNPNAPELKGRRDAKFIRSGNLYKYTLGEYPTMESAREARNSLSSLFPQAFVIRVENNAIVPLQ